MDAIESYFHVLDMNNLNVTPKTK